MATDARPLPGAAALASAQISERAAVYLRPDPILWPAGEPVPPPAALPFVGGPGAFISCTLLLREPGTPAAPISAKLTTGELFAWAAEQKPAIRQAVAARLEGLTAVREPFADIAPSGSMQRRPLIMGVVNVTPDSFSDGGLYAGAEAAIAHGKALAAAGADILDIGGESTRPGSEPVDVAEELRRVLPVIQGLAGCGALLSVDTSKAAVMREAVAAGAHIINDVRALDADPEALEAAAESGAWIVLMHCRGEPKTMQQAPVYDHAALDVFDYLAARIAACEAAGIPRARIAIDPGIGFGKTVAHNLQILQSLALYQSLGCPVLLGVSRKSFIGRISGVDDPCARLPGSLAVELAGLDAGVDILRVHDVAETAQATTLWRALRGLAQAEA